MMRMVCTITGFNTRDEISISIDHVGDWIEHETKIYIQVNHIVIK